MSVAEGNECGASEGTKKIPTDGEAAKSFYPSEKPLSPLKSNVFSSLEKQMLEKEEDPWALPELKDDSIPWSGLSSKQKVIRVCIGVAKGITLIVLLYLFVCSLDFLSSAFRLVGGKKASSVMSEMELLKNPVVGLMLGVLATVLVQSSSTSSSIIITMVGSGLLMVKYSIPIIMGVNIGTSVTNTFVAISQVPDKNCFRRAFAAATIHDMFNWLTVFVLLPLEVATGFLEKVTESIISGYAWEQNANLNKPFLTVLTKPFTSLVVQLDKKVLEGIAIDSSAYANATLLKKCCGGKGESLCGKCSYLMDYIGFDDTKTGILMLVLSIVMLGLCLYFIVKVLKSVLKGQIAVIIKKLVNAEPRFPFNHLVGYAAMFVGCGMTILVQSSSIFTSALTPLAGIGVITMERMYPLTLGSNVGTTTTGILAALAADPKRLKYSLQIAFCHLFFNISGILLFYPIPFMRFPIGLAKKLGNITATYKWFSLFYILLMFVLLPLFVFGLSTAGSVVFMSVGLTLLCLILLILVINIVQCKRPSLLPYFLRNWNFLPMWMHSLEPMDRALVRLCAFCKCCRINLRRSNDGRNSSAPSTRSVAIIIESSQQSINELHDNKVLGLQVKPESTNL